MEKRFTITDVEWHEPAVTPFGTPHFKNRIPEALYNSGSIFQKLVMVFNPDNKERTFYR